MNNEDRLEFKKHMTVLGEIYNKEITKPLLTIYFQILGQYPIDIIVSAMYDHVNNTKSGQFFPKPADIKRIIEGQGQSVTDRAMVAWAAVQAQIAKVGAYGDLDLDDKQALAAIRSMGSWASLCHTHKDKMGFKQQEFLRLYEAFENTNIEDLPKSLPGLDALIEQKSSRVGVKSVGSSLENISNRIGKL